MNREESIALAYEISKGYHEQEKLQAKIEDLDKRIARPINENIKHYTAFEFFTKFLAASFIVTFALSIPTFIFCGISEFLYKSGNTEYANSHIKGMLFLAGVFALIHLIGGFIARKKRDENNRSAGNAIMANEKLRESLKKDLRDLLEQYDKNCERLKNYDEIVPEELRRSVCMDRLKAILLTNKAEDFEEGIRYILSERQA